jgi:4,5-DOPA dioxygenase extradiol
MQASHDTDHPKSNSESPQFPRLPYRMPAWFVGHGSPMNAIEDSEFSRVWAEVGQSIPTPKAILCISAHWETGGTRVTAMERPRTIHDFHGFPKPLFDMDYPAPGEPALARLIRETVADAPIILDYEWGLDHGAWSVLCRMFPQADIPVVQLSLDRTKEPAFHYGLGKSLRELRNRRILVIASGNIVHNLGAVVWQDTAHAWALAFDGQIKRLIVSGDHDAIIHYERLGDTARASVPTAEHFLPLLYLLGLQEAGEETRFFNEKVTLGAISMTSVQVGGDRQSLKIP